MTQERQIYSILIASIIITSCNPNIDNADKSKMSDTLNSNKIDTTIKFDKNDDTICSIVYSLPEVKERANYIEKESKGARHLRVEITETPKETNGKYYWVRAGEINDIAFVTHFNFVVYPNNFDIKYYDPINDTIISLEIWRKINKQH